MSTTELFRGKISVLFHANVSLEQRAAIQRDLELLDRDAGSTNSLIEVPPGLEAWYVEQFVAYPEVRVARTCTPGLVDKLEDARMAHIDGRISQAVLNEICDDVGR